MMATAGKVTVAEVEELVAVGRRSIPTRSTRRASSSTASSRARITRSASSSVTTRPRRSGAAPGRNV